MGEKSFLLLPKGCPLRPRRGRVRLLTPPPQPPESGGRSGVKGSGGQRAKGSKMKKGEKTKTANKKQGNSNAKEGKLKGRGGKSVTEMAMSPE